MDLLLLLIIVLLILAFAGGFAYHLVWIIAAVLIVFLVFSVATRSRL